MSESRQALAALAEREAMACIGCHDCMLACPLPEAATITIAELNAAVHLPVITNPNVVRFVTACTQCRQCVPVCPADLSRADMVLFNKMKVEDTVPDHALMIQIGTRAMPSTFTLDRLAKQIASLPLFTQVALADLRRMILKATLRQLASGEILCREGEFHERLTLVLHGALEQISATSAGPARILVLGPGSFFGEMAIMADQPEPFTVIANEPSIVLELPKATVHRLMDQSEAFARTMDELYNRRALSTYARRPGALGALPEQAIQDLLRGAALDQLRAGQTLFHEGEPPAAAYLVRSGFLRATRRLPAGVVTLVYFREGDLFGALPILRGERAHSFGVQASSRAEVIRIEAAVLRRVLATYPNAHSILATSVLEVERVARGAGAGLGAPGQRPAPSAPPSGSDGKALPSMIQPLAWDVLIDQGVAQGREVLVIDQSRCVSCSNCVDACGRRHGHSRLELRGLQVENLLFPTACRHCDDPVCLLCSVSGIVRRPGGEISIVEDNCIGCGACAERCPYGNIRMHEVDAKEPSIFSRFLDFLSGSSAPREKPKAARKAVKCDLCASYDDYACVTACPVGAAFRVDPKSVVGQGDVLLGLGARRDPP